MLLLVDPLSYPLPEYLGVEVAVVEDVVDSILVEIFSKFFIVVKFLCRSGCCVVAWVQKSRYKFVLIAESFFSFSTGAALRHRRLHRRCRRRYHLHSIAAKEDFDGNEWLSFVVPQSLLLGPRDSNEAGDRLT